MAHIGIFDSGLGGLTVYKELKALFPFVEFSYLADSKRCPYGIKSFDSIETICESNLYFLLSKNIDYLVIACHTASIVAYEKLRSLTDLTIFPMHTKTADFLITLPQNSSILILGTPFTIKSSYYQKALGLRPDIRLSAIGCPLLVEYIERQIDDEPLLSEILDSYQIGASRFDYVLLACTHFPLIAQTIQNKLPESTLLDPAFFLKESLKKSFFIPKNLKQPCPDTFYVHGKAETFDPFASFILRQNIHSHPVNLEDFVKKLIR